MDCHGNPPQPILCWTRALCCCMVLLQASCGDNGPGTPDPDGGTYDGATDGSVPNDGGTDPDASLPTQTYEVVVVGGGSGGVAAAIQAARMGASVALVEETDWLGGQMAAAGVSNMDGGNVLPGGTGIYDEFRNRVRTYYGDASRFPPSGKSIGTCYWNPNTTCFEPSVGRAILEQMVTEAGVTVFYRTKLISVTTESNVAVAADTDQDLRLLFRVLIDATEYGDVIPLTPARYRVGNSLSTDLDPTACIQDLTYTAILRRYPGAVPAPLQIMAPPPQYAALEPHFEAIVTLNGVGDQTTWPPNYPVSFARHNAYRGMPDSTNPDDYTAVIADWESVTRTGVNWANDHPGASDTLKIEYLEDPARRREIDCEAKLLTINFIYYVQHALGQSQWSVADDEGYDSPYNLQHADCENIPLELKPIERLLPVMPYVRESRRIVASTTLTAAAMWREGTPAVAVNNFPSSIAVGDYPNDLHNCNQDEHLEADLGELRSHISPGGPFQVPLESLLPETVDGFLAAEKNIGVSRLAAGSIRLQPITMATGQASGALAALAAQAQVQPRQVAVIDVQQELLAAGCALSRFHFADVELAHPHWAAVQLANVYEIMSGYSHDQFGVEDALTRAHSAIVIGRLFELDTSSPPTTPTFDDVTQLSHPAAYAFVEAMAAAGYTSGCSANPPLFCPNDAVTRAQLAVFLVRGLGLDPAQATTTPFFDDVPVSHPFFGAVQLMASEGLMEGCQATSFCPDTPITRGETAAAIAAVLVRP